MANEDEDDNIPTLHDILRPGDGAPARRSGERSSTGSDAAREHDASPLTEAEIEAIAYRVIEQHTEHLHKTITEAIHEAIDAKKQSGGDDTEAGPG